MRLIKYSFAFFLLTNSFCNLANAVERDSLRLERRPEGHFVIHRVEAGETLYALSKRYDSDLVKIAEINKLEGYSIDVGQIVAIPYKTADSGVSAISERTKHTVKAGETLYAISHIYGLNIYDIKKWNNLDSDNLKLGQELFVSPEKPVKIEPIETTQKDGNTELVATTETNREPLHQHIVRKGETLYSIAGKYGIEQDELIRINNLANSDLSIGQTILLIAKPSGNSETIKTAEQINENTNPKKNKDVNQISDSSKIKIVTIDPSIDTTEIRKPRFGEKVVNDDSQFEKIYEEGIAMEIENSPKTKKYLCLHRSLPIGTILQVKNLMNSQSIFVRVVGKLPDIGGNENVLIRLSSVAYKRLGAIDAKFPVELSYIP